MKFLVLLALLCMAATANAQVHCLNPGTVLIPASPCCGQAQGEGLAGAVGAFFDLLDLECKLDIFFDRIITDPDVLAFFNYITGPEFREILLAVQDMREFQEFMEYFCYNLDLDMYLYLNTLGDIIGTPRIPHPEGDYCHPEIPFPFITNKKTSKARPAYSKSVAPAAPIDSGVRRLFDDLGAEMPSDAIYEMWLYKIENDPYLCEGFLKLSHPNFIEVAYQIEHLEEFIVFVEKLEEWGIEMYAFMDYLKEFLWYSDYCREVEVETETEEPDTTTDPESVEETTDDWNIED